MSCKCNVLLNLCPIQHLARKTWNIQSTVIIMILFLNFLPQHHKILHHFFAQVMINAIHRVLREEPCKMIGQFIRALQVFTKRFFNDHSVPTTKTKLITFNKKLQKTWYYLSYMKVTRGKITCYSLTRKETIAEISSSQGASSTIKFTLFSKITKFNQSGRNILGTHAEVFDVFRSIYEDRWWKSQVEQSINNIIAFAKFVKLCIQLLEP